MTRHLLAVFEKSARAFNLTPAEKEILNEQITEHRAMLNLFEGKHRLKAGDAGSALENFEKANEHLRTSKLALVIFLLRYAPRLVVLIFAARERFIARQPDHKLSGIDQAHATPSVLNESH